MKRPLVGTCATSRSSTSPRSKYSPARTSGARDSVEQNHRCRARDTSHARHVVVLSTCVQPVMRGRAHRRCSVAAPIDELARSSSTRLPQAHRDRRVLPRPVLRVRRRRRPSPSRPRSPRPSVSTPAIPSGIARDGPSSVRWVRCRMRQRGRSDDRSAADGSRLRSRRTLAQSRGRSRSLAGLTVRLFSRRRSRVADWELVVFGIGHQHPMRAVSSSIESEA